MREKDGLENGDTVEMINRNLIITEVTVKDAFMLYAGKTMIMSTDYYREALGTPPQPNTYYIKAAGKDPQQLMSTLLDLPGVSSVELSSDLKNGNKAVLAIYNVVVIIVITFSVFLSFMILLNLSNILVAHRMREILTMRINGFSKAQVIGYLVREVLLTGLIAMAIAVGLGLALCGTIMQSIETNAFMFVRQPYATAWIASVLINTLFSVVINAIAFRGVNSVPLTDISKY
jgi:putative ABC transport system permease protein